MDLGTAGLREQPFPTHGKPLTIIPYQAQREALDMLRETLDHRTGLSLLQGPALSGKSILVRRFIESIDRECAVALVEGKGVNTARLLLSVLHQFGYDIDLSSANEMLGLVRVFALQQAASGKPPLIIVENVQELRPSALRSLCELAELRERHGSAIKMVLASDCSLRKMMQAPAMECISRRVLHDVHLHPMTCDETTEYLHRKLQAAGRESPAQVFPKPVCDEIWHASAGWPGIVDRIALLALARADCLPVNTDVIEHPALPVGTWNDAEVPEERVAGVPSAPPQLVVTNNGSVIQELTMERARLLIGRSDHNDISISSRFISRHHAMLVRHGPTTFLMDLNSTNGTFVNSKRISNHVLMHDDVITVGHHRIKFSDPFATRRGKLDSDDFADTAVMKTLEDMRSLLAKENTALMATATEDPPTLRT